MVQVVLCLAPVVEQLLSRLRRIDHRVQLTGPHRGRHLERRRQIPCPQLIPALQQRTHRSHRRQHPTAGIPIADRTPTTRVMILLRASARIVHRLPLPQMALIRRVRSTLRLRSCHPIYLNSSFVVT
jgi:hypothetical protein